MFDGIWSRKISQSAMPRKRSRRRSRVEAAAAGAGAAATAAAAGIGSGLVCSTTIRVLLSTIAPRAGSIHYSPHERIDRSSLPGRHPWHRGACYPALPRGTLVTGQEPIFLGLY